MKKALLIWIGSLMAVLSGAQTGFSTRVPSQSIVAGESFQVQYVVSGKAEISNFKNPVFQSFRFVSGPNQYTGTEQSINASYPVTNFVITLEAVRPGRFLIPGATAIINGKPVRSNDVWLQIYSKQDAAKLFDRTGTSADYHLQPGEDPYKKIKQNLFLKVMVDRTSCYTGEPVVATFKLYSRLQSRSDIVKNPGFYGFTVYDMVNLDDKEMTTEEINGKLFDVHTIRKVQLFPLQEGLYTIDAMEVTNKVEFSRSVVNKKTEQEIIEGVLNNEEAGPANENTEVYETKMSTAPVFIRVKALPDAPALFDGAVGHFSIASSPVKNKIAKNEEGVFEITITGRGNFTQLNAPVITWPAGIEAFDPTIKDTIDKTQMPLKGSRTFRYSFTCSKEGHYQLPAVSFAYFDPGGSYKTISSPAVALEVGPEEKRNIISGKKKVSITATNRSASRIAAIIIISLVAVVMIYWLRYKKGPEIVKEEKIKLPTVEEFIAPAYSAIDLDDREFYGALRHAVWNFFMAHFQLAGSDMNKDLLITKMRTAGVTQENMDAVDSVLRKCEAGMFTRADIAENKTVLLDHTAELLHKISSGISRPV